MGHIDEGRLKKRARSERRPAIRTTPGGLPEKLTPFPPAGQGKPPCSVAVISHGMRLEHIDPDHGVLRRQPFSPSRYGCGARLILVTMRKRV